MIELVDNPELKASTGLRIKSSHFYLQLVVTSSGHRKIQ